MPRAPKNDAVEDAADEAAEVEAAAVDDAAPDEAVEQEAVEAPAPAEDAEGTGVHPDIQALLDQGYKHSDLEVRTGAGGFVSVKVANS